MLDSRPIITGESLIGAKPNQVPIEGTVVEFTLSNEGGRKFRAETAKHIRDYMAIVLDQRVMGRPPVIQSAIGTRGQITMGQGRSLQDAQDLALVLRAGALPVPLKVSEVRNIGASLGADSIREGIRALFLAMALVVLILIVYYRFSGVLAVCRARALRGIHDGHARVLQRRADLAGPRRFRALGRYRRRRKRADFRAYPRGAGTRQDGSHGDR
jgi:preprotein translocase subunit SecD